MADEYEFTTDWFSAFSGVWGQILERYQPALALEIGSFEGRSACFMIERCGARRDFELHCLDTWAGGVEHDATAMAAVEARFDANIGLACERAAHAVRVEKDKTSSMAGLVARLAQGRAGSFDLIYVDGSHQAPDVLADAVLAFQLLRVGGVLIFDDYLWSMEARGQEDFYNLPKPAIDAFVNIFQRKLTIHSASLYQLYMEKTAS